MNKNILIKKIEAIGLTDNEAKLYVATMENGTSPASRISKTAKLNRVTTYDTLNKLLQKGLVSVSNIHGIKHFTALAPELFIEDAKKKAEDLTKTLPFLKTISKTEELHPTVRYFEGLKGIKQAYKETLSSSSEILCYSNPKNIRDHWPEYDDEYVAKRIEKKIFLRDLFYGSAKYTEEEEDFFRKMKPLPRKHFRIENEINIFDNKVLIVSYEPRPFAIIIESHPVADTQRQIFETLWDLL